MKNRRKRPHRQPTNRKVNRRRKPQNRRRRRYSISRVPKASSNAEVLGGRVVPASPDDRFRNRPPIYPREAAMRGEHGAVVILIHVSENGVATGVDVMETSGVASLDKAAVDAVLKWHFRPALHEGLAVPFAMRFRFIFDAS